MPKAVEQHEITEMTVRKTAQLARLALSEDEITHFTTQLSNILHLVDQINEVLTDGVAPMCHSNNAAVIVRDDVVTETDQRTKLQKGAPAVEAGLYLVSKVIEGEH